jgi:nitrogen fixation NifU-like protein
MIVPACCRYRAFSRIESGEMSTGPDDSQKQPLDQERALNQMRGIYTETVIDHVLHPRNFGSLPGADGFAGFTSAGSDNIKMWLRVRGDRITEAAFWTDGCAATIASLSMITELARGTSINEAMLIGGQDVLEALGGLPEGNVHCALQAARVLKEALRDYQVIKKEPWKKTYRQH